MHERPRDPGGALLRDAYLVFDYAIRSGQLKDETLSTAIADAESKVDKDSPNFLPLAIALNNTVKAIAPMTLIDLRAGRNPFDERYQRAGKRLQIFVCILAVLLTSLIAYYSQCLHLDNTALNVYQEVQDAHPLDRLTELRKLAEFAPIFGKQRPQDSRYDEYHLQVRELRDLQAKISASGQLLNDASNMPNVPLWNNIVALAQLLGWPKTSGQNPQSQQIYIAQNGPAASWQNAKGAQYATLDPCDPREISDTLASLSSYPDWLRGVIGDNVDDFCFARKLNLEFSSINFILSPGNVYDLQNHMALLNGWVLPLLYGLLGSSVFLLRNLLNPGTRNIGFFPTLVRIAVSGIAGIAIGWFWVPTASQEFAVSNLTSIPFGLAFLLGFSIDTFFLLLDRLNRGINGGRKPEAEYSMNTGPNTNSD